MIKYLTFNEFSVQLLIDYYFYILFVTQMLMVYSQGKYENYDNMHSDINHRVLELEFLI